MKVWAGVFFIGGFAGLFQFIKLFSGTASRDLTFALQVLSLTAFLTALTGALYGLKETFTGGIRLREPNEREEASHKAEVKILLWVFGLLVAGVLMAVTDTTARLRAEPTAFVQGARKATIILFTVGLLGTLPVLRRLSADLLLPPERSKKFGTAATVLLLAFGVCVLISSNLPPAQPGTVGEALTRGVSFAQLLFCVAGLILSSLTIWQARRERNARQDVLARRFDRVVKDVRSGGHK
jgi:hypothetical protein